MSWLGLGYSLVVGVLPWLLVQVFLKLNGGGALRMERGRALQEERNRQKHVLAVVVEGRKLRQVSTIVPT